MKAEIIAVGTELLLGQIVNTNAQYIAQGCAGIGLDVYYQTVVGDNRQRLRETFALAASRADFVIVTGGLGPTQDDLTKDALAELLGLPISIHGPSMERIEDVFRARGLHMVESNSRQANVIEGCDPFPNDNGLAVGVGLTHKGTHYVLLPGPPKEMKPMFDRYAVPWIRAVMGEEAVPLHSKMLKFAGIGESNLEHRLIDLIDGQQDPTIAPYAKEGEVSIRLTTRASSPAEAERKLAETERVIRDRVGEHLYAVEDVPIERVIVELLSRSGKKAALAESCTGGLASELLTAVPGSSAALVGAIVCYTNAAKRDLLGVPESLLEGEGAPGAISAETAAALAERVMERTGADYALSITGVAGPAQSEGKPVGLVYIGIAERGKPAETEKLQLSGNRGSIRLKAAKQSFYRLWQRLRAEAES
ncbi:competence/damage-inducible protein A [Paenibacillus flagellatus]|uniref:Putative competence-damage inducible protein n=1 Tax=Paenibacillus flagellatus TaxID=2211139 RepID=A0A2V5KJ84_9BACL|nr:competence/damage-inducible protein A [Paenibacillus flagellatus]PYI50437.1 competence/damage-inducible protein A [Paenibacillus flagellatus]